MIRYDTIRESNDDLRFNSDPQLDPTTVPSLLMETNLNIPPILQHGTTARPEDHTACRYRDNIEENANAKEMLTREKCLLRLGEVTCGPYSVLRTPNGDPKGTPNGIRGEAPPSIVVLEEGKYGCRVPPPSRETTGRTLARVWKLELGILWVGTLLPRIAPQPNVGLVMCPPQPEHGGTVVVIVCQVCFKGVCHLKKVEAAHFTAEEDTNIVVYQ
jgi:hypothetical protein